MRLFAAIMITITLYLIVLVHLTNLEDKTESTALNLLQAGVISLVMSMITSVIIGFVEINNDDKEY